MPDFDFQPYLDFVQRHYSELQGLYTPTDAVLPLKVQSVEKDDRTSREEGNDRTSNQKIEQFPVLDGLRKYALGNDREHVLLAGRPGSGKSMALGQLAVALAKEGQIPVLVQLKGDRSVSELIKSEFRRAKVRVTDDQIDEWLFADRLVLLLDGVNEIPTEKLRQDLAQFREDNLSVPMVFTTRDLAIGGDLGIGKRFEMKPLSPEQLREFVEKYLPSQGEQLLKQLRDRLKEISETPLLLKMLCDVFDPETGQIPQNKGELFREFDRKYEQFKGLPAVSPDFRRFKSEVLQHLAFVMMTGDEGKPTELELTIDRTMAEKAIENLVAGRVSDPGAKAKEWLEDLLEHHLLQVATDDRRVEFRHQLFQEYYAAEALLVMFENHHPDVIEKERFQHFYLNYLKWTETIAIVLSLMRDEEEAVQVVKWALEVDLMLGARLAGETNPQLSINGFNVWIRSKRRIDMEEERVDELFSSCSEPLETHPHNSKYDDFNYFKNTLIDINSIYEERETAIVRLSEFHENSDAADFLNLFLEEPGFNEGLKALALRSLAILNFPVPYESVQKLLVDTQEFTTRATIIEAIGIMKYAKFVPQLIDYILGEKEEEIVMSTVISSLLKIKEYESFSYVEDYLKELDLRFREMDNYHKFQSYNRFLGYVLLDLEEEPELVHSRLIPHLPKMCSEKNLLQAFQDVGHSNSCHVDKWVSVAEMLAKIGHDPAIKVIISSLGASDESFGEAIEASGRISLRQALPQLFNYRDSIFENLEISDIQPTWREFIDLHNVIKKIQANCKFYNYEIEQAKLRKADRPSLEGDRGDRSPQIIIQGDYIAGDKIDGDKYEIDRVGNLNTGDVTIHGNQNGEQ